MNYKSCRKTKSHREHSYYWCMTKYSPLVECRNSNTSTSLNIKGRVGLWFLTCFRLIQQGNEDGIIQNEKLERRKPLPLHILMSKVLIF